MDSTLQDFAHKLGGKTKGNKVLALCPAHDDKSPSLSLTDVGGKILFHCFAGCSQERLIEKFVSLGLWNQQREETRRPLQIYQQNKEQQKPEKKKRPTVGDVAHEFIMSRGFYLNYYRDEFYLFKGKAFEKISDFDVKADLISYLRSRPDTMDFTTSSYINDIFLNLKTLSSIRSDHELPCWLDAGGPIYAPKYICLQNGILNLDGDLTLEEHSPLFFTTNVLPYKYESSADCPKWKKFLSEALPDPTIQSLLMEWFGYNLIYSTQFEKFALLEGQGANGKSTCCTVLKTLIGHNNFSSVPLEAFDPNRTFPLASTIGKLANIVEEIGEVDKTAEGFLKQYVSGSHITIDRKFLPAVNVKPTARLTFAANTLPKFNDKSHGIWRRILLIPFRNQILDESRQDKRLLDPNFWIDAGEMSGVLNWALKSLGELLARGHFIEPSACKEARAEYKNESNPTKLFFDECIEVQESGQVKSKKLYDEYRRYMSENGYNALSHINFTKEIRRAFPGVTRDQQFRDAGRRDRMLRGIKIHHTMLIDSLN